MRLRIIVAITVLVIAATTYGVFEFARAPEEIQVSAVKDSPIIGDRNDLSEAERIKRAKEKSENIKALYMTAAVANDQGRAATNLRNRLLYLLDNTEINGIVIDVKETDGDETSKYLKPFIEELHAKDAWVIARVATFRDNSQTTEHPEYYLKRSDGKIWRDNKGNAWMDSSSPGVRQYLLDFSKKISDLGFDELQYDYVRFPSDGNVKDIRYPVYDPQTTQKHVALKDFFEFIHNTLKDYRSDLMLSADLFGYVAIQQEDLGIGQRLADVGQNFDYISLMLYPSHFYSGFYVPEDKVRSLPAVSFPYKSKNIEETASAQPYQVILRSLYTAEDILAGRFNPAATTTTNVVLEIEKSTARLRPWLQDFDLGADTSRGIYYDTKAVRAQIDAAEDAGASGWILWSPTNTYTEAALEP